MSIESDMQEFERMAIEVERLRSINDERREIQARAAAEIDRLRREYADLLGVHSENEELRNALDAALYFADNLQRIIDHKPVRDLAESRAAAEKARRLVDA